MRKFPVSCAVVDSDISCVDVEHSFLAAIVIMDVRRG